MVVHIKREAIAWAVGVVALAMLATHQVRRLEL
jgi:hypothetical protein